nr:unnamed protein product [Haemonchus contortus]
MYRIDGTVNFFRRLRREAIRAGIRSWHRLQGAINLVRRFSREAIRTGIKSDHLLRYRLILQFKYLRLFLELYN